MQTPIGRVAVYYGGSGALAGSSRRAPSLRSSVEKRRTPCHCPVAISSGIWDWAAPACCPRRSSSAAVTRPWPSRRGPCSLPTTAASSESARTRTPADPARRRWTRFGTRSPPRVGRGYPPDYTGDLVATIAEIYGVSRDHVIVGTGSGPILEAATRAFCSAQKPLVTAAPTYGTADQAARRIGAPVKMITVDKSMGLDTRRDGRGGQGRRDDLLLQPEQPDRHGAQRRRRGEIRPPRQAELAGDANPDRRGVHRLHARPRRQDRGAAGEGTLRRLHHPIVLEGARDGGPASRLRHWPTRDTQGDFQCLEPRQRQHADRSSRHRVAQGFEAHRRRASRKRPRARLHAARRSRAWGTRLPTATPTASSST